MSKFYVVAEFIDYQSGLRKKPGETVEASGDRIAELKKAKVIGSEIIKINKEPDVPEVQENNDEPNLTHVGGGYYILPDGRKMHGRNAAFEALKGIN